MLNRSLSDCCHAAIKITHDITTMTFIHTHKHTHTYSYQRAHSHMRHIPATHCREAVSYDPERKNMTNIVTKSPFSAESGHSW